MKPVSTQIVNGSVKTRYDKTSEPSVSERRKFEIVTKSAPRIAICGKIVIDNTRYMTNERPWKRKRPRAKAADEPIASESSVTDPATIAELSKASVKKLSPSAPR